MHHACSNSGSWMRWMRWMRWRSRCADVDARQRADGALPTATACRCHAGRRALGGFLVDTRATHSGAAAGKPVPPDPGPILATRLRFFSRVGYLGFSEGSDSVKLHPPTHPYSVVLIRNF